MTETTASDSSGQGKISVMFITRLCTMSFPLFIAIILLITRPTENTGKVITRWQRKSGFF